MRTGAMHRVRLAAAKSVHDDAHEHHLYRDIRALLEGSELDSGVRARALDIFARLAAAESEVHGVPAEDVSFHEVGAYDSIADVVCAAWLIERLDASWSCGPLPIGRGRIDTAHGRLPVPAPATVALLRGMVVDQDTHLGERITPTGAAIVAHLAPSFEPLPGPMRLDRAGTGFGTSRLPGTSNVLRLLAFRPLDGLDASVRRERIAVCEFEIDDQTGEDLALALDRVRILDGVLDVSSHAVHGKKGRLAVHVRLLARIGAVEVDNRCMLSRDDHPGRAMARDESGGAGSHLDDGDGGRPPASGEIGAASGRRSHHEGGNRRSGVGGRRPCGSGEGACLGRAHRRRRNRMSRRREAPVPGLRSRPELPGPELRGRGRAHAPAKPAEADDEAPRAGSCPAARRRGSRALNRCSESPDVRPNRRPNRSRSFGVRQSSPILAAIRHDAWRRADG